MDKQTEKLDLPIEAFFDAEGQPKDLSQLKRQNNIYTDINISNAQNGRSDKKLNELETTKMKMKIEKTNEAETETVEPTALELSLQSGTSNSFANKQHTGAMVISPTVQSHLEIVRATPNSTELRKLAKFIPALQTRLEDLKGSTASLIDAALLAPSVPVYAVAADVPDHEVEQASMDLDLVDGLATVNGMPVWDRLPGEKLAYYTLFTLYRDMRYCILEMGDYSIQNRTLAGLAKTHNISGALVANLAKIYHWSYRCQYFDYYMDREIARRKALEAQVLQSEHLKVANKLVEKALVYLDKNSAALKPKDALTMLELGLKFGRISLGMMGDRPGTQGSQTQTSLAIYNNTTNNNADNIMQIHTTAPSEKSQVESNLDAKMKENSTLLSVLNVLQQSGAMDVALGAGKPEVVEGEYTVTEGGTHE